MAWEYLAIFLAISALCCCVGFRKFVYFLSVGYGFSVIGLGVAYAVVMHVGDYEFSVVMLLECLLLVVYGARLSYFLLKRELKNKNYRKVLSEATGEKPMPVFIKIAIWVSVSALYVMQTCPVFYRFYNGFGAELSMPIIGVVISVVGLTLETLADHQKSAQKAKNPDMVATRGLFRVVRCPNYLGELIFWAGVFISGFGALRGVGQWTLAILGYALIVVVMFNGAQRLDRRQEKRYGQLPEYRAYADHTPILLPFIPLYHIGKSE